MSDKNESKLGKVLIDNQKYKGIGELLGFETADGESWQN